MAMSPPPPRRGPLSVEPLFDDLMREIFLRLPPHDPRGLVRAAVGCRSWRGILSDAALAREYRRFHRAPPMLGFFYDQFHIERRRAFDERYWLPHFVSTATFRLPAYEDRRDWRVLDSRHGLVLFYTPAMDADFVVCDLVTGDELEIHPDSDCEDIMWWEDDDDNYRFENIRCNAAVLCGRDRCDHLNCHGGPFRVALLGSDEYGLIAFATVYSSETREWSDMISAENPNTISNWGHSAVVGNKVYVPCLEDDSVVEYNMGEQKLSVIDAPFEEQDQNQPYISLMGVEDGMLLFASVVNPRLYLWSMEASPRGTVGWARRSVIELEPLLPPPVLWNNSEVLAVGFAEGVSVIFLMTNDGLYTIDLNSGIPKSKKVHGRQIDKVVPYMSFYTGARGQLLTLE